jgi:hypothetical protein
MTMTPALAETLTMVAEAASAATDGWWIIGSAALVLHGRRVPHVRDVDLMMSAADAEQLLRRVGGQPRAADAHKKFRSLVFGTWTEPPVPVEIFGGFSLAGPGGWREVSLSSRESVDVGGRRLFVPSVEELALLLHTFGRPKDLERARILEG